MWLLIYSFLIGGGAARLAETRPLTEERVVRPPPCVRDPTPKTQDPRPVLGVKNGTGSAITNLKSAIRCIG